MDAKGYLNVNDLRKIWKEEFLPSIKRELKSELEALRKSIKTLTARIDGIEKSQSFISEKYESVLKTLKSLNQTTNTLGKKDAELTKIAHSLAERANRVEQAVYRIECAIDEVQQYSRRDCLEITGIPILPEENPKQLIKEIGTLIDVNVEDANLAAAHRLPDTKNVKHRLIVKFVHRDKREEMYKKRRNLIGKNISNLPSVQAAMGLAATSNNKIHINESLTGYRKQLFGRINDFKRKNNYKYLWTANGKIMLKAQDSSQTKSFVTHEEFEDYIEQISNNS